MTRFACCALVLLLAACPNKGTTTTTQPQAAGAGCPPAAGVYLASYVQQEPGKGRSGWAVALMAKPATGDAN